LINRRDGLIDVGFGQDEKIAGGETEPIGAQFNLLGRLFPGDIKPAQAGPEL
jgi:hypothetical protein